jgi:hypothetical protein
MSTSLFNITSTRIVLDIHTVSATIDIHFLQAQSPYIVAILNVLMLGFIHVPVWNTNEKREPQHGVDTKIFRSLKINNKEKIIIITTKPLKYTLTSKMPARRIFSSAEVLLRYPVGQYEQGVHGTVKQL